MKDRIYKLTISRLIVVGLCLVFQVAWLVVSIWKLSRYYIYFAMILGLLGIFVVLFIISKRDNPAYKLAWTVVILAVPIFGVILYLVCGRSRITRAMRKKFDAVYQNFAPYKKQDEMVLKALEQEDESAGCISRYISSQSTYPVYQNTDTEYFPLGDDNFKVMLEELKKARHFIFMEYFIVHAGVMWDSILEILEQKVKEGVEVRFLYDDMGCVALLPYGYDKQLEKKGIQCRAFNPFVPFLSIVMNNRDHRKIMVIDGHTGFTGGINLADEYINVNSKYGHWKDTGIMLKGDAVQSLTVMFLEMWNGIKKSDVSYEKYLRTGESWKTGGKGETAPTAIGETVPTAAEEAAASLEGRELFRQGFVQPYCDTPLDHECVGESVYLNIINRAKHYVYIYTPYLIVDNEMMTALCLAAKSGVDVRIITPHIPDKKLVFLLTQSYYSQLIDAGVHIYEYTPGFVHAKCFLSDDKFGTVGTINLDYRSLYLHFECGVFLYKTKAVEQLKEDFAQIFPICTEITKEFCDSRPWYVNFMQILLRLFAPLL